MVKYRYLSFKTFILDPEVGYRILDNEKGAFVDVLGGLRYLAPEC